MPDEFIYALCEQTYLQLIKYFAPLSEDNISLNKNCLVFINHFIQIAIARAENDFDECQSKSEQYDTVSNHFAQIKLHIQEQVADAFTHASEGDVNYSCFIRPLADPINLIEF